MDADVLIQEIAQAIKSESLPPLPEIPSIPSPDSDSAIESGELTRKLVVRSVVALAATVAFVTFFVWPQSQLSAVARMKEALASVKTICYTVRDVHADGKEFTTRVMISEPNFSRVESEHNGEVYVVDWNQKLSLSLNHLTKVATVRELSPTMEFANRRQQLLAGLRDVSEHATESAWRYDLEWPARGIFPDANWESNFRVTVDLETGLPLQMEFDGADEGQPGFKESLTDFVFDTELTQATFAIMCRRVMKQAVTNWPKSVLMLIWFFLQRLD